MHGRRFETEAAAVDVGRRDYQRLNMNWYVRNFRPGTSPTSTGGMVPIDPAVDANGVVTAGHVHGQSASSSRTTSSRRRPNSITSTRPSAGSPTTS